MESEFRLKSNIEERANIFHILCNTEFRIDSIRLRFCFCFANFFSFFVLSFHFPFHLCPFGNSMKWLCASVLRWHCHWPMHLHNIKEVFSIRSSKIETYCNDIVPFLPILRHSKCLTSFFSLNFLHSRKHGTSVEYNRFRYCAHTKQPDEYWWISFTETLNLPLLRFVQFKNRFLGKTRSTHEHRVQFAVGWILNWNASFACWHFWAATLPPTERQWGEWWEGRRWWCAHVGIKITTGTSETAAHGKHAREGKRRIFFVILAFLCESDSASWSVFVFFFFPLFHRYLRSRNNNVYSPIQCLAIWNGQIKRDRRKR